MNQKEIQQLIQLLGTLEKKLQESPVAAERYSTALKALKESLGSISSREFIGSTSQLNTLFKALANSIQTGLNVGLQNSAHSANTLIERLQQLANVAQRIESISLDVATRGSVGASAERSAQLGRPQLALPERATPAPVIAVGEGKGIQPIIDESNIRQAQ